MINPVFIDVQAKKDCSCSSYRYYVFGVVICPMVFYIPKFFELKTVYSPYSIRTVVDCASIIEPAGDLRGGCIYVW